MERRSLKQRLKPLILKILAPVAKELGYARADSPVFQKAALLHACYSTLAGIGFRPAHIVDVGANRGEWTRQALYYFPDARFTLLEPQRELQKWLQDVLDANPKVTFNAVGAGARPGTFKFTLVDREDSCTFAISEDEARAQGFRQVEVPVVTLNAFLADGPPPDMIKIDAEGIDLEVLQGASNYFGKTEVFLVEAGVMNKGFENSVLEIVKYMDEKGYRLFDITDLNRPLATSVLWLVELAFIKKNGVIDSKSFV